MMRFPSQNSKTKETNNKTSKQENKNKVNTKLLYFHKDLHIFEIIKKSMKNSRHQGKEQSFKLTFLFFSFFFFGNLTNKKHGILVER